MHILFLNHAMCYSIFTQCVIGYFMMPIFHSSSVLENGGFCHGVNRRPTNRNQKIETIRVSRLWDLRSPKFAQTFSQWTFILIENCHNWFEKSIILVRFTKSQLIPFVENAPTSQNKLIDKKNVFYRSVNFNFNFFNFEYFVV